MKNKKCTSLFLALALTTAMVVPAYGSSTQNKISDARKQQSEAKQTLQESESKIEGLEAKKNDLEAYLTELNEQLSDLSDSLSNLQKQSDAKQKELKRIQKDLDGAKEKKEEQYESMKLRIQYMYEQSGDNYITMLMESQDLADFLNRAENIMQITKYDRDMLNNYKEIQREIEDKEAGVLKEKAAIEKLQEESIKKQEEISDLVKSTNSQIEIYAEQITDEQTNAKALLTKVNSQEDIINGLIKQQKEEEAAQIMEEREEAKQEQPSSGGSNTSVQEKPSAPAEKPELPEENTNQGSSQGTYLGRFRLTAYCNGPCCGGHPSGKTASGTYPAAGRTVAMGGVPFGTKLLINGNVYIVEDRGTPYGHVDIYHDTHGQALQFGSQYADVYQLN